MDVCFKESKRLRLILKIFLNYNLNIGYFYVHPEKKKTLIDLYINSLCWGTYVLTGTSFNDVYPITKTETVLSLFLLVMGSLIYGKIFGDFEKAMHLIQNEKQLKK